MTTILPVVECFHSLQGEGAHTGRSAYFIRLAICTVGCPWCDTKNSWSEDIHSTTSVEELATNSAKAKAQGAAFVVITGGEPLHHNLDDLCNAIRRRTKITKEESMPIHLETSGVNELSGSPDWITLSPKKHAPPTDQILSTCQELKVIIHQKDDLLFAEKMAGKIRQNSSQKPLLFLQAGWNNKHGENLAFEYVKNNPEWRLSMQTHKWLKIS
tara:strand:- start:8921 stop:9562 length:642 start_codon:yes stop_codon:yes gene_type:complete